MKTAISNHFRAKRDTRLRELILSLCATRRPGEPIRILDVGGRAAYWERVGFDFLRALGVRVTVLNCMSECTAPPSEWSKGAGLIVFSPGDGCSMPSFADNHFDLVHSNSVIEHVGDWSRMKAFAAETRRVGRSYYVQTPNFWFPVDPHTPAVPFYHWFPRPIRAALLQAFPIRDVGRTADLDAAHTSLDGLMMLDRGMMAELFPGCALERETLGGMVKSWIAIGEFQ